MAFHAAIQSLSLLRQDQLQSCLLLLRDRGEDSPSNAKVSFFADPIDLRAFLSPSGCDPVGSNRRALECRGDFGICPAFKEPLLPVTVNLDGLVPRVETLRSLAFKFSRVFNFPR